MSSWQVGYIYSGVRVLAPVCGAQAGSAGGKTLEVDKLCIGRVFTLSPHQLLGTAHNQAGVSTVSSVGSVPCTSSEGQNHCGSIWG